MTTRGAQGRRTVVAVVGASAAALLLSACGSARADVVDVALSCQVPDGPMAFAVGGRANTPALAGTPALSATVTAAAAHEAHVVLLDTGGQPALAGSASLVLEAKNGPSQERERAENAKSLATALSRVVATSPEANPLEALNLAADAVRSAPGGEQGGTIVLVDSGLQTEGAFSYTQAGMLAADPDDVVEALGAAGQLPDLSGMTVYLVGIGQTSSPQEALDAATRRAVLAQWRAIVDGSGAACVDVDDTPRSGQPAAGLPAVTAVDVPKVQFVPPTPDNPLYLGDQLRFESNSDQYVDPEAARTLLEPVARWMGDSGSAVTLTGTTATDGTPEGRKRLSLMRAEAVKRSLAELGADPARIATEGAGTDHPSHVDDLGPNGELLPGPAAQNRLVIVSVAP